MPESEPTSKQQRSQATQERLLAAAFEEFQFRGLAGARVDRIAERAQSNKRLIYVYFGDKEKIFDTVVVRHLESMIDAVHFTARDLPGYAVTLFDYLDERPDVLRLFAWRNLERAETSEIESASYRDKVAELQQAQREGSVADIMPAAHLLAVVLSLVQTWAVASPALVQVDADPGREQRRESIRKAVADIAAHRAPEHPSNSASQ